ncbi:MAG: tetraacyldisaccharide 4'-kinase [Armatimonadetes bacterium]|nr:tetraacyldisaccharide 4'-kinase [Armatimonadota bacterium]
MPATPDLEAWYLETVSGQRRGLLPSLTRGLLAAASWGYSVGLLLRELTYLLRLVRPVHVGAHTVSVGNLTLGGTGKTPAVIHLARRYQAAGGQVAVLIRGHGARKLVGCNVVHDGRCEQLTVADAGDEALLIARLLNNVPVLAGKDRRITAREAVTRFGATVLLLDDGFQYRRLHVDEHIVLLDATQPFGTGRLFPAGTLRDPASALRRAAEVWITRADHPAAVDLDALTARVHALAPGVTVKRTCHAPARLTTASGELPLDALAGQKVVALAGIGNPRAFAATLASLGAVVVREAFYPDHHPYSPQEQAELARQAGEAVVVTTEKDQMRLGDWPADSAPLWVLGIELRFV